MRKSVRDLVSAIGRLRATIEVQRHRIARRLGERLAASPRAAEAYPPVLEHLEAELATLEADLVAAENAYLEAKQRLAGLRRLRERAVRDLHQLHAPLERHLTGIVEMPGGGRGGATRDPHALVQQAGCTVDVLRVLESDPPPPILGVSLDPAAAAADLGAARERLAAVLGELTAEESDVKLAQAEAEAAIAHCESVAPWVARTLEGLAGLAQARRVSGRVP